MSSLDGGTAALRGLASSWSLSGDKQLLDLLQNIHKRIIEKCKETKSKFEEMDAALDNASVTLQNVNNKFMALSNTQFIESRVYDDDEVCAEPDQTKQPSQTPSEAERPTSKIARGLRALFNAHESVRIMHDSDSDSDSDSDDNRTVLRPRDMYSHRPLPYIIGSQAWKSKWHVGLVAEESDSDSSTSSKQGNRDTEQYSDSGPETADEQPDTYPRECVESTYSSGTHSEDETIPQLGANPSEVAAELARRLSRNIPEIHTPEPETETHQPVPRKIYKPEKPPPGNIFFDEPPPLDSNSYTESSAEESDIFAELHTNTSCNQPSRVQNVTEDLFRDLKNAQAKKSSGENVLRENIVSDNDFNGDSEKNNSDVTKKYVGRDVKDVSRDIGDNQPTVKENKKPIGGVSLFGAGAGVDGIGAAILKRNRRQSNSSDDDLGDYIKGKHTPPRDTNTENVEAIKAQTEIFDRLFEKSEKLNKSKAAKKENAEKVETQTEEKSIYSKVDLFSDDLFDDIDDIFSSVPTVSTKEREGRNNLPGSSQSDKKTLFDDGEDIFADIAEVKTDKNKNNKDNKVEEKKRGLFDSDDDLFDDKSDIKSTVKRNTFPNKKPDENKTSKGLFDESEDELFANVKDTKVSTVKGKENTTSKVKTAIVTNITSKDKDFVVKVGDTNTFESDDLFSNAEKRDAIKKVNSEIESRENRLTTNVRNVKQKPIGSPALFDDDEEDDLFKIAIKNTETSSLRTTKIISDHESLITSDKKVIENEIHEDSKDSIGTANKRSTFDDSNSDDNVKLKSPDNVFDEVDDEILFTNSESRIVNKTKDLKNEAHDFNKNFNTKPKFVEPKLSEKQLEEDDKLFRNDSRDNKSLDAKCNVIDSIPSDRIFDDEVDDLFNVRNTDSKIASKFVDPKPLDSIFKDNDNLFSNTVRSDPLGDTKTELEKDSYESSKIKSKSPDISDDKEGLFDKIPGNSTNASNILDDSLSVETASKSVNPKLLGENLKGNNYPDADIEPKMLDKIIHGDENEDMFKMSSEKNEGLNSEERTYIKDYFNAESKVEAKSLDKIFKDEEDGDLLKKTVKDNKNAETIDSKTESYRHEENCNRSFKTNETKTLDNVFDDENDDLFKITSESNSAKIKTHISKSKSEILDENTTKVPKPDSKSPKKLKIFDDDDADYLFSNKVETDVSIGIETTFDTTDIEQQGADVNTFTQTIDTEHKSDLCTNIKETTPNQTLLDTEIFYDNIFADQPPEFEKPKEPKKSKNVNALFDDDSDDEALFFKRNDIPFDDKPKKMSSELTPSEVHTVLGLFGDEPPAIDFDNPDNDNGRLETSDPLAEQYFKIDFTEVETRTFDQEKSFKTPEFKENDENDITDVTRNKKIIGQISTNIDINVKALLPGASPKKLLDKGTKTKIDVLNEDSKDTKTVTFKGTDSTILDNTLSKERAKIPIRRRPSTRRARRDAATKSGIGFEDDLEKELSRNVSEDSSKNDISKPGISVTSKTVYILNDEDIFSDLKLPTKDDLESFTVSSKTVTAVDENPLFKNTESGIHTLGKVYKNPKIEKDTTLLGTSKLEKPVINEAKKSLFESSDDDGELFGAKKKMAREKSKSIFDSDSGDELFGGKK